MNSFIKDTTFLVIWVAFCLVSRQYPQLFPALISAVLSALIYVMKFGIRIR